MHGPHDGRKARIAAALPIDEAEGAVERTLDDAHGALRRGRAEIESLGRTIDLEGRVRRHPYAMLAAAAGTGYVLGGGLFRPFAGRVFRTGLRLALVPLLEQAIVRLLSPPSVGSEGVGAGGLASEAGDAT